MSSVVDDPADPPRDDLLGQLAALPGKSTSLAVIEQAKGALMVTRYVANEIDVTHQGEPAIRRQQDRPGTGHHTRVAPAPSDEL